MRRSRQGKSAETLRSPERITRNGREELLIDLGADVKLILIGIKAGSFVMGSPEGELGRGYNETQHRVTLTKDYWLGKYPVTQRQYETVVGRNPSAFCHIWPNTPDYPVENVSWNLARRFCNRLNELIKLLPDYRFDLPTEAQWEYACRAGTTTALNSGSDLTTDWGKCPALAGVGWYEDNCLTDRPVGRKKPNAWGLYDMHGSVFEWCRDWYECEYASDPEFLGGQKKCEFRVARGGGHRSEPEDCRSAKRECFDPKERYKDIGFRLALVPVR